MTFTVETLHDILASLSVDLSKPLWVAYSGGVDSHVLLHALSRLRKTHAVNLIKAIHVNHSISPNAHAYAQHCLKVCNDLDVECILKTVDVPAATTKNDSLEEVARNLRYQAFKEILGKEESLLLAHHRDDQAETFLLQALRGAGLKGLSSMPVSKPFVEGKLIRPLLAMSRQNLLQYAEAHELIWVEDESNASAQFDRNYVRHHVLPGVIERFPAARTVLSRSAEHCAEASGLLDELAREDLRKLNSEVVIVVGSTPCGYPSELDCHVAKGQPQGVAPTFSSPVQLPITQLLTLSPARQKNVLRFWIQQNGFLLPSQVKLKQLLKDVLLAKPDASPCLTWEGAEVRRYRDRLYLMPPLISFNAKSNGGHATLSPPYESDGYIWDIREKLVIPGVGVLRMEERVNEGFLLPEDTKLTVKFRQGGERMQPAGTAFSRELKNLFQEWGVPPWLRGRIPLIYDQDVLVMVVGYAVSEHYVARGHGRGKVVLLECPSKTGVF